MPWPQEAKKSPILYNINLECISLDISPQTLEAVRKCIAEGRRVASHAASAETRDKLNAACDELDKILAELSELQAKGEVSYN